MTDTLDASLRIPEDAVELRQWLRACQHGQISTDQLVHWLNQRIDLIMVCIRIALRRQLQADAIAELELAIDHQHRAEQHRYD